MKQLPELLAGKGAQRYHALSLRDDSEINSVLELIAPLTHPDLKDLRVLDLAARSGRVSLPLATAGNRVLAVDSSVELLKILNERLRQYAIQRPQTASRVETRLADLTFFSTPERFKAVCLLSTSLTLLDPRQRQQALENATKHLAPGGLLIVSTDQVVADEPMTQTVILRPHISLTEEIDPAAGTRRTILNWKEEAYVTDMFLLPPASLAAELRHLGLSPEFQRSVADPSLPHHSNVVMGAAKPQ